jgi:hypothetical protein
VIASAHLEAAVAKPKRKSKPSKKPGARKPTKDQPPTEINPNFAPVVDAFAKDRQVVCGKGWGAGNTVLKVKGKIFAMTVSGNLVVKISKARAAELVNGKAGTYFDPRHDGRLMKEWVVIEPGKTNWIELAREAHSLVGGATK